MANLRVVFRHKTGTYLREDSNGDVKEIDLIDDVNEATMFKMNVLGGDTPDEVLENTIKNAHNLSNMELVTSDFKSIPARIALSDY